MALLRRKWIVFAILIIVPLGFASKFYTGPLNEWVNNSLGGILYVVFWSLVGFFFFPKSVPLKIARVVFLMTCMIEFLQLWHPLFLEIIRSNFLGRTLLGSSFSWWDILHYGIGFIISAGLLQYLDRKGK